MIRPNSRLIPLVLVLTVAALGAAGCGTNAALINGVTAPTVAITETFTGTVSVSGAAAFSFNAVGAGAVTATYNSIASSSGVAMGLALGIWNGTACNVVIANDNAFANSTIVGASSAAGSLCVRAYDIGKLDGTQTVQISVTHF